MMPLPQTSVDVHVLLQPSASVVLPSSHASPRSTIPLPQVWSDLQSREQPSGTHVPVVQSVALLQPLPSAHLPSNELWSSQISPGSSTPLPQPSCLQSCAQPSPSTMLPSSHSSPGSTVPS